MTHDQWQALRKLIYSVQDIRGHSDDVTMPFPLANAIIRADQAQNACYQFIEDLKPVTVTGEPR